MALTKVDDRGLKTPIDLQDSEKIRLGTGNDVELHHDGTNSILNNTTGELQVTTDGIMRFNATEYKFNNAANNEIVARFEQDGTCELYHNHSKKIETTASGVDITGNCTITGHFRGNDNVSLKLGNGDDLQIYHDGTDDRIMSGSTNSTIFASKYLRIMNQAANETMAKFTENGAVELNYDNVKKFETLSFGAGITDSDTTVSLQLQTSNGTCGYLSGLSNDGIYLKDSDSDNFVECVKDGAVSLYWNGVKQCSTENGGLKIQGGDTSNETMLRLVGNEGRDSHILFSSDEGDDSADHWRLRAKASDNSFDLVSYASGSYTSVFRGTSNRELELHYQGARQAITASDGLIIYGGDTSSETKLRITGNEGQPAHILFSADEGDDAADHYRLRNNTDNTFDLVSYTSGSYVRVWVANGGTSSSGFFAVKENFYIGDNYDHNYSSSDGIRFMPFGGGGKWFTSTFNTGTGANTPGPYLYNRNGTHNGTRFYVKVDGGVVNHSGNNSNLCDERMKTNIADAPSYYNTIKSIGIKKFNYKTEPEGTPLKVGVIAQQVETIESDLVDDEFAVDGPPNEESTTKMKSVHEEQLFMMGIKALQEAIAKIETLETKVAALEAA